MVPILLAIKFALFNLLYVYDFQEYPKIQYRYKKKLETLRLMITFATALLSLVIALVKYRFLLKDKVAKQKYQEMADEKQKPGFNISIPKSYFSSSSDDGSI